MRVVVTLLLLLTINLTQAQESSEINRYFVYFTEKQTDTYPYSLNAPEEFLTDRAIERRKKQKIEVTESDLPVNPDFVSSLELTGVDVFFTSKWLNGVIIQSDASEVAQISQLSFVDSVALIAEQSRLTTSQNPITTPRSFAPPPDMRSNTDFQLIMLNADQMHREGFRGEGMRIAVLDNGFTGVNLYEPFADLWTENRIIATKDFVENSGNVYQFGSHGTNVLSIIGAKYETDTTNFFGIAHEAEFILCITEEDRSEDRVEEYNWLLGAEYADSLGADIINSSLGYQTFDIPEHNYSYSDTDGKTAICSIAASIAAEKGIIVVTSAGNSGDSGTASRRFVSHPADAQGILTVGSVNVNQEKSTFSSIGPTIDDRIKPDVSAFGDATALVNRNGMITRGPGTSFSTPLIAGFAAGIWQANPTCNSQEVIRLIKISASQADAADNALGYGVPNYSFAVSGEKALSVQDILTDMIQVFPNPFRGEKLYLKSTIKIKKGLDISLYNSKGELILSQNISAKETKKEMELTIKNPVPGLYFLVLQSGSEQKTIKLINF